MKPSLTGPKSRPKERGGEYLQGEVAPITETKRISIQVEPFSRLLRRPRFPCEESSPPTEKSIPLGWEEERRPAAAPTETQYAPLEPDNHMQVDGEDLAEGGPPLCSAVTPENLPSNPDRNIAEVHQQVFWITVGNQLRLQCGPESRTAGYVRQPDVKRRERCEVTRRSVRGRKRIYP
jgi:hypothetical protein